jgi:O-antigen/teichoic acid export membrane protein
MPVNHIRDNRSTLVAQAVRLACKAVSVVVLARILTPTDHGLYAMAGSVTVFLLLFRDLGFGTAAIQAPQLDATQRATLGWIHVGLGGVLTLLTLALAPAAVWFYAAPEVGPLLQVMSVSFLLMGAGGFIRSQLVRELRFSEINRVETIAAIGGTAAMIAAGAAGAGAFAFAVFLLVSELLITVLAWRAWRWRPAAIFDLRSVRPLLQTGADLTVYNVLSHCTAQLDTLAVGQAFGPRVLGLYNRSALLLALPHLHVASPLTQVALASLSRLGGLAAQFREQACRTVTVIAYGTLPLAAVSVAVPGEILRLVLGEQWPGAAPILRWLAVSSALLGVTIMAYGINVAAGRTRQLVWTTAAALPCTIAAILVALPHGAVAVASSLAITHAVLAVPRLYWTLRGSPVTLTDYLGALALPLIAAATLGFGAWLGAQIAGSTSWSLRLAIATVAGSAAVALLTAAWPRLRHDLREVRAHLPWSSSAPATVATP